MNAQTDLSRQVGALLRTQRLWLATAESCSGGLLGHLITTVPGASEYYLGGVVAYSNSAKMRWLKVRAATLRRYGAVSRETALEMAAGVRFALRAHTSEERIIGVAITGVAGPGGGMPQKPVGSVWIALDGLRGQHTGHFLFSGQRLAVMEAAAQATLAMLKEYLGGVLPA